MQRSANHVLRKLFGHQRRNAGQAPGILPSLYAFFTLASAIFSLMFSVGSHYWYAWLFFSYLQFREFGREKEKMEKERAEWTGT